MKIRSATAMVPNLFTVGNMALGFFAILAAFDGRWVAAPAAIFIAHGLDILDGRVARWMKVSSPFGGQFDSFADWISFGIAPAIMVFLIALKDFGKMGFLLTFLFVFAGAFRLARFNLKSIEDATGTPSSPHFVGLPIPGAGGFLAILVLLFGLAEQQYPHKTMMVLYNQIPLLKAAIPAIVFSLALLMMSKVPYATFKRTHFFRPQSYQTFMVMLFVCFMIYAYPENTIFIIYLSYILWGLVNMGIRTYRLRKRDTLVSEKDV